MGSISTNYNVKDCPNVTLAVERNVVTRVFIRFWKKIDVTRFKQALRNSDIVTKPKAELNELVNQYNSCLSQLLDKPAP